MSNRFEELYALDVNDKVEKKQGLSYLSWAFAWAEFKKIYPDATYEVIKFQNEKGCLVPYMEDELTGYMVNTKVTVGDLTHEMWLPVMDNQNRAMKCVEYEIVTKTGKPIVVKPATMFDVNKAIMRCLVKNLAMFGLGLYIYAGEDLPEETEEVKEQKAIDLASCIENCKSDSELRLVYEENKKQIAGNPRLLELMTKKGRSFKGVA